MADIAQSNTAQTIPNWIQALAPIFLGSGDVTSSSKTSPVANNALLSLFNSLNTSTGDYTKDAAIKDSAGSVAQIVQDALQKGLPDISSAQKGAGVYNDATTQLLQNDLIARTAAQGQTAVQENINNYAKINAQKQNTAAQVAQILAQANESKTTKTAPTIDPMGALLKVGGGILGKKLLKATGIQDKINSTMNSVFNSGNTSAVSKVNLADSSNLLGSNDLISAIANPGNLSGIGTEQSLNSFIDALTGNGSTGVSALDTILNAGSGNIVGSGSALLDAAINPATIDLSNSAFTTAGDAVSSLFDTGASGIGSAADNAITNSFFSGSGAADLSGGIGSDLLGSAGSDIFSSGGTSTINDVFSGLASGGGGLDSAFSGGLGDLFGNLDFGGGFAGDFPVIGPILDFAQGDFGGGAGTIAGFAVGGPVGGVIGGLIGDILGGGSVICTELYSQGIISSELLSKDVAYARANFSNTIMKGYWLWAIPYVRWMRRSSFATKLITIGAIPFCNQITGTKKNLLGKIVFAIGVPLCWTLGTLVELRERANSWVLQ